MGSYRYGTFYGIVNPFGQNIIEGDYCEIKMKNGNMEHGRLIDACADVFTLSDDSGEKTYRYEDIKSIMYVEKE